MQHLSHIFHITAAVIIFLLSSCSNGKTIIPQKTMAGIIGDMYLADQYIEEHPEFRAQMDTLLLYEAVVMRHGYTFNDYRNSVEHYLQKGDALKKIHLRARKSIIKQRDELNEQLRRNPVTRERWWAEDSIMAKHVNTLWKEPYLRNFKWLSGTSAKRSGILPILWHLIFLQIQYGGKTLLWPIPATLRQTHSILYCSVII